MTQYHALQTFRLAAGTGVAQTQPLVSGPVTLDSPALQVMTDLTQVKAATTHPTTLLRLAEQAMIYLGVRVFFVVTEMPAIEGLITHTDLHGDKAMRVVSARNAQYNDLCVADVMTPCCRRWMRSISTGWAAPASPRWWPRCSMSAETTCWWSKRRGRPRRRACVA